MGNWKIENSRKICEGSLLFPGRTAVPGTLVGASASLLAFTLSFVGEIPSAEILLPRYTTWSSMNWNLLGFKLSPHSCSLCNTRFSRWISSVPPDISMSTIRTQQPFFHLV